MTINTLLLQNFKNPEETGEKEEAWSEKKFGSYTTTLSCTLFLSSQNFWKKEKLKFSHTPCTVLTLPQCFLDFWSPKVLKVRCQIGDCCKLLLSKPSSRRISQKLNGRREWMIVVTLKKILCIAMMTMETNKLFFTSKTFFFTFVTGQQMYFFSYAWILAMRRARIFGLHSIDQKLNEVSYYFFIL